jgi:hypothetical protein
MGVEGALRLTSLRTPEGGTHWPASERRQRQLLPPLHPRSGSGRAHSARKSPAERYNCTAGRWRPGRIASPWKTRMTLPLSFHQPEACLDGEALIRKGIGQYSSERPGGSGGVGESSVDPLILCRGRSKNSATEEQHSSSLFQGTSQAYSTPGRQLGWASPRLVRACLART